MAVDGGGDLLVVTGRRCAGEFGPGASASTIASCGPTSMQHVALEREQEEVVGAAEPEIEQADRVRAMPSASSGPVGEAEEAVDQVRPRPAADVAADGFGDASRSAATSPWRTTSGVRKSRRPPNRWTGSPSASRTISSEATSPAIGATRFGCGRAEHVGPLGERHLRIAGDADVGRDAVPAFLGRRLGALERERRPARSGRRRLAVPCWNSA